MTPACQFPLGVTMRMEQRLRLLDVAERLDAWIIEDDFDGEYRFQGRPVPAMQGIDRSDRVIYLGTFAKLLFPALRLGFMILPVPLLESVGLALRSLKLACFFHQQRFGVRNQLLAVAHIHKPAGNDLRSLSIALSRCRA